MRACVRSMEVNNLEIVLEVWGDFACFSQPQGKVERLSFPVPTPSAVRGILSSIYSKPAEFFWQVNRIEVLNPIRYISFKRNEATKGQSYSLAISSAFTSSASK